MNYTITNNGLTVIIDGKPHTMKRGEDNFEALRAALLDERFDDVPKLLKRGVGIEWWSLGEFKLAEDHKRILYAGEAMPDVMVRKVLKLMEKGTDARPLLRFHQRLQKNPSYRSVQQLYRFLENKGIPIAEDGCILAYKGVRPDYMDVHSGTFNNSPGQAHEMPRNRISDDPKVSCHVGFHVGNHSYATGFGSRVVICKVDPEHVVCVPYDSSSGKMRVCKYEVVGNYGDKLHDGIWEEDILVYAEDDELPEISADDLIPVDEEGEEIEEIEASEEPKEEGEKVDEDPYQPSKPVDHVPTEDNSERREELRGMKFDSLRRLATAEPLLIKGAGRIKGGKEVLIDVVLDREAELAAAHKAEMEKALKAQEAEKRESEPVAKAKKPGDFKIPTYDDLDRMGEDDLDSYNIGILRKYARHRLNIVGASKIRGGKSTLIAVIVKTRKE